MSTGYPHGKAVADLLEKLDACYWISKRVWHVNAPWQSEVPAGTRRGETSMMLDDAGMRDLITIGLISQQMGDGANDVFDLAGVDVDSYLTLERDIDGVTVTRTVSLPQLAAITGRYHPRLMLS